MAKKLTNAQKRDYQKFFVEKGDPGFSPERNEYIINKSIEKYEAMRKQKMKDFQEQVSERSDAIATYLKHLNQSKFTPVEKYFGKRNLAYLQGQNIANKLKQFLVKN